MIYLTGLKMQENKNIKQKISKICMWLKGAKIAFSGSMTFSMFSYTLMD